MADAPPFSMRVRSCTLHPGRYRWDISQLGRPILSSEDSFATEIEAEADGLVELAKLAAAASGDTEPPDRE
jgi:hypothetical protein